MKRKCLFACLIALLVLLCAFTLASCKKTIVNDENAKYFTFTRLKNGTYEVSSLVADAPTSVSIPARYNGKAVTSIGDYVFRDRLSLEEVLIPEGVKRIGEGAFMSCTALNAISIPNSVTEIGFQAFQGSALSEIILPKDLKNIAANAFMNCPCLTEIELPSGLTEIGEYAFAGCELLPSLAFPVGLNRVGDRAFSNCRALKSFSVSAEGKIPGFKTSVFEGCSSLEALYFSGDLTEWLNRSSWGQLFPDGRAISLFLNGVKAEGDLVIPQGVQKIGDYAFRNVAALTSITIPRGVKAIGSSAFSGCTGLSSISFPETLTEIGWNAFGGCAGLTSLTLPESVMTIRENAFKACSGLTALSIPKNVVTVYYGAFADCSRLTSVSIAEGSRLSKVERGVFQGCSNLERIDFSGDLAAWCAIGDLGGFTYEKNATVYFNGKKLEGDLTIPAEIASIGQYAFCNFDALASLTLVQGQSPLTIGSSAFANCAGLTSVAFPREMSMIGSYAFERCTGLTSIVLPEKINSIGEYAFWGCTGLTSMEVHLSPKTNVGDGVCANCKNETSIYFDGDLAAWCEKPNATNFLGDGPISLFLNGKKAEGDLVLPSEITSVGDYAFFACIDLISVTVPRGIEKIGCGAFGLCAGLTSVFFEEGSALTEIGEQAFALCENLSSIALPEGVTKVGKYAFECSGLHSLTLPQSVAEIGTRVLFGCESVSLFYEGDLAGWCNLTDLSGLMGESDVQTLYIGGRKLEGDLTLSSEVKRVGAAAFRGRCELTSIVMPRTVKAIGEYAFYGCSELKEIFYQGTVREWKYITKYYGWHKESAISVIRCKDGNVVP